MALYPSTALENESRRELVSGMVVDVAADGSVRARSYHNRETWRFTVRHRYITQAQADELQAFYADNKLTTIDLVWKDGYTYECVWDTGGLSSNKIRGAWYEVEAHLIGRLSWADLMVISYRARNPEQAAWFDGAGSSVETELRSRLDSGGYLYTTFGPDGQNKTTCDFLFLLTAGGDWASRTVTKSGDTLRWDFDDTVYAQNNTPAHTLGAGTGIVTCSTTDGWGGVTVFGCNGNNLTNSLPDFSIFTAVGDLQIQDNGLSQALVDQVLGDLYAARATFTDATPALNIAGTNAAPSGAYADEDPPTTGLGYVYELENDPEGEGFNVWSITNS